MPPTIPMALFISSLNSGSNGNCYYIGNETEAILIDAGISCRETEKRMKRSGLSMEKVKAIFISHEHGDHISGLPVLSRKHKLPVYITAATERFGNLTLDKKLVNRFTADEPVTIGNLSITAFQKEHGRVPAIAYMHSVMITGEKVAHQKPMLQ